MFKLLSSLRPFLLHGKLTIGTETWSAFRFCPVKFELLANTFNWMAWPHYWMLNDLVKTNMSPTCKNGAKSLLVFGRAATTFQHLNSLFHFQCWRGLDLWQCFLEAGRISFDCTTQWRRGLLKSQAQSNCWSLFGDGMTSNSFWIISSNHSISVNFTFNHISPRRK